MQLMQLGPRAFHKILASTGASVTPLADRALIVRRIILDAVSATDTWIVSCAGRETGRFRIDTLGNQQMLGGAASAFPKSTDIFNFVKYILGQELSYPCPQGQTFNITSAGGATADIFLEYTEHSPADLQPQLLNHPEGSHFLMPVYLVPKVNITHASGVAEDDFASQIAALWIPQMFGQTQTPAAYQINILGFFLEGAGRNTFSGAADHQSITDHLALIRNGQRLFTRDAVDGIPVVGPAAAAGSANTVYGSLATPYPAFQLIDEPMWSPLPQPLPLRPGDQYQFLLGTSGDSTGGADYSHAYAVLLADITTQGLLP